MHRPSARTTFINIVSLLCGRLGYRVTTALAGILIARAVSIEEYGLFTTALAWSSAMLAFNDLGLSAYMLKTASKKDPEFQIHFGNTLFLQTILSFIICITLSVIGTLLFSPFIGILFAVVSFGQLAYEFRKTFRAIFRSHHTLKYMAITEISAGLLFLISVIVISQLAKHDGTILFYFALAGAGAQIINVSILYIGALRLEKPRLRLSLLPRMLVQARHFFLYNIFVLLYFQIDQILISLLRSPEEVAVYAAPAQLITLLLFIPFTVFQATTPLMFEWFDQAKEKYYRLLNLQLRSFFALALPCSVGIFLLADSILHIVYGQNFFNAQFAQESIFILKIFAVFLTLRFISIVLMNALLTSDNAHYRMRFQIIAVLCNTILDLLLIPFMGPKGGAIATLCVEIITVIGLLAMHTSLGSIQSTRFLPSLLKSALAAALLGSCILLLQEMLPVIVLIFLCVPLYAVILFFTGFFTDTDKQLVRSMRKSSL